ncbi:MAG: type VII secretion integral membrane protein EccD [Actinobacteria bacterium 13_2_20CM_2_71_6]|nr:MAG: type VII secretion integral membrane protein EccD [Actinobacteria bacterium 13_2_20CM_2_71_6]
MTTATGLARVTVSAPQRRLDVALPEHAPLAELLPELLRHAGEGLPDAGQAHGGWVLRRTDGTALSVGAGLAHQGVRDGDVLHLVPARVGWPELEYDDVVDAIAAGARRYGRVWDGTATRATGLVVAGVALLLGAVELVTSRAGPPAPAILALAVAGLLVVGGVVASRGYGDGVVGASLGGFALPYALVGGYLLLRGVPGVLVGATALLLVATVGAVGVGHGLRIFVGGVTAGCLGVLGALLAYWLPAAGAAAVVLAVLVTGVPAVPLLAIRLGRLPMPVLTPDGQPRPDRATVFAAVVRTDEMVTGMLLGHAAATLCAATVLAMAGGTAGRLLVGVAGTGFLLRARLFPTVRQRLPLLVAGAGGVLVLLFGAGTVPRLGLVGGLVALGLLAVLAGAVYRRRAPGPYLGRAADILDALCVVAVIPVACAVLGLYGRMRGLIG